MSANSFSRRVIKRVIASLASEQVYAFVQAVSIVRDIRSGSFAEPEVDVALAALRPGDAALDLGANYGMYTIPMANRVGAGGRIYAFEPIPSTAATLRIVARLFRTSNVDIRVKGCAAASGAMTFTVPLQSSGAVSAGQAHAAGRDDQRPGHDQHVRLKRARQTTCEVVALDDELRDVREIALIKADIEGMELLAFRGARRIIERDRPTVITEINPWFLAGFGVRVGDLLEFFGSLGYAFYCCDDDTHRLHHVRRHEDVVEDNYVFVHPRRTDRLRGWLA